MRSAHLVAGRNIDTWSISWKASMPSDTRGLDPPMAISGEASIKALATPVSMLIVPGPDEAMQTPGFLVRRVHAWAIIAAACSWWVSIIFVPSRTSSLSVSSIGPPIRKNSVSMPCALSALARISDPVNVPIVVSSCSWMLLIRPWRRRRRCRAPR